MKTINIAIENPKNRPFTMEVTIDFMAYNSDPKNLKAPDSVDVLSIQDKDGNTIPDSWFSQSDKAFIIGACFDAVDEEESRKKDEQFFNALDI